MNSYPLEFLAHPQPLMFVAGLGTADEDTTQSPVAASSPPASLASSPPPTFSTASGVSPPRKPSFPDTPERQTPSSSTPQDADFNTLIQDLRETLRPYIHKARIWLPPAERRRFRVELVDRNVQLPARKAAPERGSSDTRPPPLHSPLSPFTPGSPMYPDGLIAPAWVRKHADYVPSVFVSFMRLYENPSRTGAGNSPLGEEMLADAERQQERLADEALVQEIAELRKRLAERNVKLTVVLIASSQTLESPGLDSRLSNLRRSAGLGAKGSLFVLTPVPASELPDFIRSLQETLWDPAMEYYAAHGKRVRQKRGRVPANIGERGDGRSRARSNSTRSRSGSFAAKPLGQQGWIVRYDFKAGWFAEARGELDLARRHYEDCWNELARMFGSTTTLPPRTKRWAEAKVLADCVAIKICKLLLYEGVGSRVMVPFFVHLRRFADLSRGWGIGEETFEFWSWVARQYRIFGEMLEIAIRNGFRVPPLPLPQMSTPTVPPTPEVLVSQVNPLHLLHPPAFYFYAAATCTIERKARFEAAIHAEEQTGSVALAGAPGFNNEKNVDHNALIVDLLTKAQSMLGGRPGEFGLELYDAYRVAATYVAAKNYEEGAKYLAKIVDKFPSDQWGPIRKELQVMQLDCVRQTGDTETTASLLIQMLAPGSLRNRTKLVEELTTLLKGPAPKEPVVVDMPAGEGVLNVGAGFRLPEVTTDTPIAFQVSAESKIDLSQLPIAALKIEFSNERQITLRPGGAGTLVDVGDIGTSGHTEAVAGLAFKPDGGLVVTGKLSAKPGSVEVSDITLCIAHNGWEIDVGLKPESLTIWRTKAGAYVPSSGLHPYVDVSPRLPEIDIDVSYDETAYVGEDLPIKFTVSSDSPLPAKISVTGTCSNEPAIIGCDGERSEGRLLGVELPAATETAKLFTIASPRAGECTVDFVVSSGDSEITKQAVIQVVPPFRVSPSVKINGNRASVTATLKLGGDRSVLVKSLTALGEGKIDDSLCSSSFPQTWTSETVWALGARFQLASKVVPGLKLVWRPTDGERETTSSSDDSPFLAEPASGAREGDITTVIPLPPIQPLQPDSFLTCAVSQPSTVRLGEPFTLRLTLRNSHPKELIWGIVSGETSEHFVWSGPRGFRVALGPGASETMDMQLVAVSGVGSLAWPGISVREGDGEDVEIHRTGIVVLP